MIDVMVHVAWGPLGNRRGKVWGEYNKGGNVILALRAGEKKTGRYAGIGTYSRKRTKTERESQVEPFLSPKVKDSLHSAPFQNSKTKGGAG